METLSHFGEAQASETLYEHMELSHYIDTFRTSAERVRRLLFIIAVFSVVMLTAYWNTTKRSWVNTRYNGYRKLVTLSDEELKAQTGGQMSSHDEMVKQFEEYSKLRAERLLFPQIPVIGVTFDVNDLGNFCGVAYLLLLPLLLFSLIREHEHLYLGLFKVRRLYDGQRHGSGGESRANYLYHALAMSQVLSSPPTLAQWRPSRLKKVAVPYVLFWFPVVLEAILLRANWKSVDRMASLGVSRSIIYPQFVLAGLGLALCYMCSRYQLDFNRLWEGAFFHINPAYKFVERRRQLRMFSLRRETTRSHTQRRLRSQAVSALEIDSQKDTRVPLTRQVLVKDQEMISNAEIDEMCEQLERQAEQQGSIVDSLVTSSRLTGNLWEVQATFDLRTEEPPRRRQPLALLLFWRHRPPAGAVPGSVPPAGAVPAGSGPVIDVNTSRTGGRSQGGPAANSEAGGAARPAAGDGEDKSSPEQPGH